VPRVSMSMVSPLRMSLWGKCLKCYRRRELIEAHVDHQRAPKTLAWKNGGDCQTPKAMMTTVWMTMKLKLTEGEGMIFRDDNGRAACSYSSLRLAKSSLEVIK
jgi:hypothetical protein